MAAQYRFGARTEVSLYFLGICKLVLGVLFGSTLVGIFQAFPNSVLGVMLVFAGISLASMAKDAGGLTREGHDSFVTVLVGGLSAAGFANDGIGFLCGVTCFILLGMTSSILLVLFCQTPFSGAHSRIHISHPKSQR